MNWLFDSAGLTPHGFCLLWEPGLLWAYAITDMGIAAAYFTIPLALAIFAQRRRDMVFRPIFWLFAAFILLCGTTHLLDVVTLWVPAYGLEVLVKAATALVSISTAIALWVLLPQALALPSTVQLQAANAALREIQERLHQSQKMETVGQLTGGMAHDFNNMLQGITGALAMMERSIAEGRVERIARFVSVARQSVDRAAALTNRMLAFARRQALQPRPVEPDKLVQGMAELIGNTMGLQVEVRLRLRDGVWNVLCDPNQLENALLNLAVNARDAMPEGGSLTIATADVCLSQNDLSDQREVGPGDYVELVVTDTGTGMSPDVLARAFDPFFTTKPTGAGTGLGLSQVFGFVHQSSGFVRLKSEPGIGTSVCIYLPRYQKVRLEEAVVDSGAGVLDTTGSGETTGNTVLVVEDEADVRAMIADALRDLGCHVIEAEDGSAGLRIVHSAIHIHLLVTDVGLPGLNGRQLAEAARERRPDLPVVLITGYAGDALRGNNLPPRMEIIRKPFALDALAARVSTLLKAKH